MITTALAHLARSRDRRRLPQGPRATTRPSPQRASRRPWAGAPSSPSGPRARAGRGRVELRTDAAGRPIGGRRCAPTSSARCTRARLRAAFERGATGGVYALRGGVPPPEYGTCGCGRRTGRSSIRPRGGSWSRDRGARHPGRARTGAPATADGPRRPRRHGVLRGDTTGTGAAGSTSWSRACAAAAASGGSRRP